MTEPSERLNAAMTIVDRMGVIIEATVAYRMKLMAADFSSAAAEQMSVDLHQFMLKQAFTETERLT